MNDFTILHLSDLHIDFQGDNLTLLLSNLIKDIEEEMKSVDNILIVVTGDLVHKGNYNYRNGVIAFFQKLATVLSTKVKSVYIVPGNHDRTRNVYDEIILKDYKTSNNFYPDKWKYIRMSFDDYRELIADIYSIFYKPIRNEEVKEENTKKEDFQNRVFRDTYGVLVDSVGDKNVCVISLNTAWNCIGDADQRHLKIGKFQMDEIKRQFQEEQAKIKKNNADAEFDLTIVIAHHPVGWLCGEEEDILQDELLSKNSLGANLYICGHTHNRDVISWQNNRHSMTTLVSGVGWPEGSSSHPIPHTYSSYVVNLDANSIDVYVRSSDDNYHFEPDFRIYTEPINRNHNKIVMPINICKTQAYINLGTSEGRAPKAYYITNRIVDNLNLYFLLFSEIKSAMMTRLELLKHDFVASSNLSRDINVTNFLFKNLNRGLALPTIQEQQNNINRSFNSYLMQICQYVVYYTSKLGRRSQNENDKSIKIRAHFRILKQLPEDNIPIYVQKAIWYSEGFVDGSDSFTEGNPFSYTMKEIKWGELIEAAYRAEKVLIASVNSSQCKESLEKNEQKNNDNDSVKWNDFITAIPVFESNHYILKDERTEEIKKKYPYLTFGVTIYDKEDEEILYILDYIKLDQFIGDLIKNFLYYMPVDMEAFIQGETK